MALRFGLRALLLPLALLAGSFGAAGAVNAGQVAPAEVAQLRERLARAEQRNDVLLWGLVIAGIAGAAVGYWSRGRGARERAAPLHTTTPDERALAVHDTPQATAQPNNPHEVPAAEAQAPASSPATTLDLPSTSAAAFVSSDPQPEPADELDDAVDVDQQAEFLLVLGQDEAAIDLLLEHLRGTGGTSPLPYLRLMEIYRRRAEPPAYERTRERFNQRFNAIAPPWEGDAAQQALDAYPVVLAQLQRAWPRPVDARALLETLLFRRGSEDERFDLPAYEELLFLHGLTRELLRLAEQPLEKVDVMLPIDEQPQDTSVIEAVAPARPVDAVFDASLPGTEVIVRDGAVDLDLSTRPSDPDHAMRG